MSVHPLIQNGRAFVTEVTAKLRADSFINFVSGMGTSRDARTAAQVRALCPLTIPELEALFHGNDLAGAIVGKIPEEGTRRGWDLSKEHQSALDRWNALNVFREAWTWGRLYGFGAIVLGLSDRLGETQTPLDLDLIREGDLSYLMVLDAQDLTPVDWVRDRSSPHYGAVRLYQASTSDGMLTGTPIHSSRLITFGGAMTSDRVRRRNHNRDLSVLQRPFDILRDLDQSWQSVMAMFRDLSQGVFRIKNLIQMIAQGQKQVMLDRMEIVDIARSVHKSIILDAEHESFEHVGAQNLSAVDPVLMRMFTRLAAAADIPLMVLLGVPPAGMNATGEADLRLWYDRIASQQAMHNQQAQKLVHVLSRHAGLEVPEIKWAQLYQPTEVEAVALEKAQAEAATLRINAQITTQEEERIAFLSGEPVESAPLLGAPEDVVDSLEPEVGSIWTDTEDGHRLQVTGVSDGSVYYVDLDAPNPNRQWRWRLASFLERAREAETSIT